MPTRTETLMWTALPNGLSPMMEDGVTYLQMSVFLSPRLETTALSGNIVEFPDFVGSPAGTNWASRVAQAGFQVQFAKTKETLFASRTIVNDPIVTSLPEPELWDRFFPGTMPYKTFKFRNMTTAAINTFAVKGVSSVIKQQYQTIAATPLLAYQVPTLSKLVKLPGVTNPPLSKILPTYGAAGLSASAAATPKQDTNFANFEKFHTPYVKPAGFEPPEIPDMDFHKALSALGNYPLLLRRLGIVIDIKIPFTAAQAAALSLCKVVRVVPVWPAGALADPNQSPDGGSITRKSASPWTACDLTTTKRIVRKKYVYTATGFRPTCKDATMKNGYLVCRTVSATSTTSDPVQMYNYNVDLAATRLMATAAVAAKINPAIQNPVSMGATGVGGDALPVDQGVLAARAAESEGLASLGQPIISMALPGLGTRIGKRFASSASKNALLVAGQDEGIVHYAEELNRGYRVDAWDSVTRQWHSLCERTGMYALAGSPVAWDDETSASDEGWVQFAAVSAPETVNLDDAAPSSVRIHESVFDWSGWSLTVARPGAALSDADAEGNSAPSKTFVGPDGETHDIGNYLHPMLPLDARFTVPPGSLSRLRFGTTYRFRARSVDLAGNSVEFDPGSTSADPGGTGDTNTTVTRALIHQRFDSVSPPDVVLSEPTKPAETPEVLVVRTFMPPDDFGLVTQNSSRHVAPPKTSVQMAETGGGLDDSGVPDKPVDTTLYSMLCARDAWDYPMAADRKQLPISQWTPTPAMPAIVPFLPDQYCKGACFTGLPGVISATVSAAAMPSGSKIVNVTIPKTATSSIKISSMQIAFNDAGSTWYDKKPFQFLVKGREALDSRVTPHASAVDPVWDPASRLLTVELSKAEQITVDLSSYMDPSHLANMGVYKWGVEKHVPSLRIARTTTSLIRTIGTSATGVDAAANFVNTAPIAPKAAYPAIANTLIRASTVGRNWMVTPPRKLTLVHAVDLPLIRPAFTAQMHAERKAGEVNATIVDWMPISGKSTSKLDVVGRWNETIDNPSVVVPKWGATAVPSNGHAFTLAIETKDTTALNGGVKKPAKFTVFPWGTAPTAGLLVNTATTAAKDKLAKQRQFFGDTKHRLVTYSATGTSRFEKYFSDLTDHTFTWTSENKTIHVPSSARPAPPQIDYIIPTFGWSRTDTSSKRTGGGLRVYLKRPWFSSGADEALGVVMWPYSSVGTGLTKLEPFVTQWGYDPLFTTPGHLPSDWPKLSHFKEKRWSRTGLSLAEAPGTSPMCAAYDVNYDADTDRWFADLVIDQGTAYFPFIKLALARFQNYSLSGLELSSVVIADFAQLTPERNASIAWASDRSSFTLTVTGETYGVNHPHKSATVTATVERKQPSQDVVGWTAVTAETEVTRIARTRLEVAKGITVGRWQKTITMPSRGADFEYRIVVREYEWFSSYDENGTTTPVSRLVYAETLPVRP